MHRDIPLWRALLIPSKSGNILLLSIIIFENEMFYNVDLRAAVINLSLHFVGCQGRT